MREPESEEFRDFVLSRGPALLRTAYLLTGDQQLSEDLVQTALEKAIPHWRDMRVTAATEAYVRTIMYRENVSIWRRRRGREISVADLPDQRSQPPSTDHVEDRLMLRAALTRLGVRQAHRAGTALLRGPHRDAGGARDGRECRHCQEPDGQGARPAPPVQPRTDRGCARIAE